jgi:hypothetical protein
MDEESKKRQLDILETLSKGAYREFNDVSDYIWKSPNLIHHETKVEVEKLKEYFPNNFEGAKIRWRFESQKLNNVFPYLIAVGNLFNVLSLFESYLLLLASEIEKSTNVSINSIRGQGINRLFNYFRRLGIDLEQIEPYHQVQVAIKVRNCLVHASGLLAWSREEKELKRIKKSNSFLSKQHRNLRQTQGSAFDEITIVASSLGDRLQIKNEYALVVSWYLRDFFAGLCQEWALLIQDNNDENI